MSGKFLYQKAAVMPHPLRGMAIAVATLLSLMSSPLSAQVPAVKGLQAQGVFTLKTAFDAAWQRQPEAQSALQRQQAASARREMAQSWSIEPVALDVSGTTDQLHRNQGSREYAVGVTVPLWLPGERSRTAELADAEGRSLVGKIHAAQLRTSAGVREAYWAWERARVELSLAQDRLRNAQKLATDVARRVKAGDMARADQHQADGQVAAAEVVLAESESQLNHASLQLKSWIGVAPVVTTGSDSLAVEVMPPIPPDLSVLERSHPLIAEGLAQAEVARKGFELARIQTRANPELTLGTSRERGLFSDSWQQKVSVGVRIPFGSDSRQQAKLASAHAEVLESESQARLLHERVLTQLEATRQSVASAQTQLSAANRRAQLARETRGFFDKSFVAGETDLPTRLRIELEAVEAEQQAARARIQHAASVSALRQTLGLLPE